MIEERRLQAAADRLDAIGRFHRWWPIGLPRWRDRDPFGREEFLDAVAEVITAYERSAEIVTPTEPRTFGPG